MVTWLLDVCKLGLETKGEYEATPFICAAVKGQFAMIKLLKQRGAHIHAKDKGGNNALHVACLYSDSVDMVSWLLGVCKIGLETKSEPSKRTPFLCATHKGQLPIAKLLKEQGANINAKDKYGNNALHYACLWSGSVPMVTWLLDLCKIGIETKGYEQRTPFICAAKKGQLAIVKLLRERGANINAKSKNGYNALYYARKFSKNKELIRYLENQS